MRRVDRWLGAGGRLNPSEGIESRTLGLASLAYNKFPVRQQPPKKEKGNGKFENECDQREIGVGLN